MVETNVTAYKRKQICLVTQLIDREVGIEARRMGLTKREWYADSAWQYDENIREIRRSAMQSVNAMRRERLAASAAAPSPIFFLAVSGTSNQTRTDEDGDVDNVVFCWNHGPIVRLMKNAPRGTAFMVPYSFGASAYSLQRLAESNFEDFFINTRSTRNIVQLEEFRNESL